MDDMLMSCRVQTAASAGVTLALKVVMTNETHVEILGVDKVPDGSLFTFRVGFLCCTTHHSSAAHETLTAMRRLHFQRTGIGKKQR